jgi:N-acetylmuramoyl-L-alanine amidase
LFYPKIIGRSVSDSIVYISGFRAFIFISFLFFYVKPSILVAQHKEVVAESGEGIYRLLTRNGLSISDNLEAFIELNREILGKDNALIAGYKYKLPGTDTGGSSNSVRKSPEVKRFEIFKGKYADVEIKDADLKGAVYYLMSGHGGPDPGTIGKYGGNNLCEDEYAYDITLRLARNLIQHGATVYMITIDPDDGIRDQSYLPDDKDEVCYPDLAIPVNQLKRLQQRTDAVNKLYYQHKSAFQRMIAIHIDSRHQGVDTDVFFYHDKRSKTGGKAAGILMDTFQKKYDEHQPGRGYAGSVSTRNLYVVKNTYPVALFVELGNINHTRDQLRFIRGTNRQAIANWLLEGLMEDFKTNK